MNFRTQRGCIIIVRNHFPLFITHRTQYTLVYYIHKEGEPQNIIIIIIVLKKKRTQKWGWNLLTINVLQLHSYIYDDIYYVWICISGPLYLNVNGTIFMEREYVCAYLNLLKGKYLFDALILFLENIETMWEENSRWSKFLQNWWLVKKKNRAHNISLIRNEF